MPRCEWRTGGAWGQSTRAEVLFHLYTMEAVGEHVHQLRSISLGYGGKSYSRNVQYAAQVSRIASLSLPQRIFPTHAGDIALDVEWLG